MAEEAAAAPPHSTLVPILATTALLSPPLLLLVLYPSAVLRYLQRKRYQYEVTFSLYMMTPTEKFIFNSILFLLLAMVSIAAALYLPASITNVSRRGWYYLLGDGHEEIRGYGIVAAVVDEALGRGSAAAATRTALAEAAAGTVPAEL